MKYAPSGATQFTPVYYIFGVDYTYGRSGSRFPTVENTSVAALFLFLALTSTHVTLQGRGLELTKSVLSSNRFTKFANHD